MADLSAMPDTLPNTSGRLDGFLKANSDTKPSSPKGPMGTTEYRKNVDEALTKVKDFEKQRGDVLIPETPKITEGPKPENYQTDPMKKFGSAASMLAVLGSMMTRHKFTNALNSAAAVNNAISANDEKAYKEAYEKWKVDTENAWKMADWQQKLYEDKLQKIESGEKGVEAEIRLIAAAIQDPSMDQALKVDQHKNLILDRQKKILEGKEAFEDYNMKHNFFQGRLEAAAAKKGSKLTPAESAEVRLAAKKEYEAKQKTSSDLLKDEKEKLALADADRAGDKAAADVEKSGGTKEDQEAARREARENAIGGAGSRMVGKSTLSGKDIDWNSLGSDDIVPGTGVTKKVIASKVKGLHDGLSYSEVGLSMRSANNPERAATDDLWATLYPNDNRSEARLGFGFKQKELNTIALRSGPAKLAVAEIDELGKPMLEAIKNVNTSQYPDLNSIEQAIKEHTGGPEVGQARLAVQEFKTGITNLMIRNGVQTDDARKRADNIMPLNFNLKQAEGIVTQAKITGGAIVGAVDIAKKGVLEGAKNSDITTEAIEHLLTDTDPNAEANFDEAFGEGAAKKILGK